MKKVTRVPLTVEEVYWLIREHFTRPDAVLGKESTSCRYRTKDGAKCAVGCLLPDALYTSEIEGRNWDRLILWAFKAQQEDSALSAFILALAADSEVSQFVAVAQKLHDNVATDAADFVRLLDAAYLPFLLTDPGVDVLLGRSGVRRA